MKLAFTVSPGSLAGQAAAGYPPFFLPVIPEPTSVEVPDGCEGSKHIQKNNSF